MSYLLIVGQSTMLWIENMKMPKMPQMPKREKKEKVPKEEKPLKETPMKKQESIK